MLIQLFHSWFRLDFREILCRLKVAHNRIFRILMRLQHRARMSENFVSRGLGPFKVIVRMLICTFRNGILQSNNILLKTIVSSMYLMFSKMTGKWNAAVLTLNL